MSRRQTREQPKPAGSLPQFTYDPLNAAEFKRRMEESFSPVYLTSISIIQGVALGLLCQQIFASGQQGNLVLIDHLPTIPYALMSFIVIVGVSYEYNWFVGIHRWSQKFLDTLIPFLLGFWEIGAIFNLAQPHRWWWLIAAFNLSGAFAFWNTWHNCKAEMFSDRKLFQFFRNDIFQSIITASSAAAYCSVIGTVYMLLQQRPPWYVLDLPAAAIYIAAFAWLLRKDQKFVNQVQAMLHLTN